MIPYSPLLVWLFPIICAPLVLIASIHSKVRDIFSVAVGFVTGAFAVSMLLDVMKGPPFINPKITWISIPGFLQINIGATVDPLSVFMATVVSCIGTLILLYSLGYMAGDESMTRYWFFMLLFIGSMIGLVMADNFLSLYIFWEMVGLCSYALIGFWYKRPEARKAGMKAFLVTRVGDVFLLVGIILIYIHVGSFSFSALSGALKILETLPLVFSVIPLLLLMGAIGKSAQLPLHTWLPDAMEGPTTVSALIHAATMVKAGVYLMARTHIIYANFAPEVWLNSLIWVGGLTALLTATMGLTSVDIKRVLAYSTVSQIGYMMLALGLGAGAGFVFASQFHLMSHAIFKALLFLCAGVIIHTLGGMRDMRKMGGLRKDAPITFITCTIGLFALSGIPPFNGFWSKEVIFGVALATENYVALTFAVITAAITFAYSLRLLSLTFLGEKSDYARKFHIHEPKVMIIPLIILTAFCIFTGFLETGFEHFLGAELKAHFGITPILLSLAAFIIGGVPAYFVYFRKKIPLESFQKGTLGSIQTVLTNGYGFDKAYYAIFTRALPLSVQKFRRTHPGILNFNLTAIIGGLSVMLILFYMLG